MESGAARAEEDVEDAADDGSKEKESDDKEGEPEAAAAPASAAGAATFGRRLGAVGGAYVGLSFGGGKGRGYWIWVRVGGFGGWVDTFRHG